jgi:hypothetical protein
MHIDRILDGLAATHACAVARTKDWAKKDRARVRVECNVLRAGRAMDASFPVYEVEIKGDNHFATCWKNGRGEWTVASTPSSGETPRSALEVMFREARARRSARP